VLFQLNRLWTPHALTAIIGTAVLRLSPGDVMGELIIPELVIPEREIRANGPGSLLAVCWRQWRTERALKRRRLHFRSTVVPEVISAYARMSAEEFDAVNGRQAWANWRTIPRALSRHVPDRPLRILDLGCGAGNSTQVLAFYAPAGSHITGYEAAAPLLDFASRRRYRQRGGGEVRVDFVAQGITDVLRQPGEHEPVPEASVDVVNSSGVVGFHLSEDTVAPLVAELVRVLKPGGVALLDVGPTLPGRVLRRIMADAGFDCLARRRSWLGDPTGEMVFSQPPCAAAIRPACRRTG
jgi:SAM-dependent methyltransferase